MRNLTRLPYLFKQVNLQEVVNVKELSEKEAMFLERLTDIRKIFRKQKIASMEEIINEISYCYIIAEKESDKEEAAWLISRLKPEYKNYVGNWCIDFDDEYERLLQSRNKKMNKIAITNQHRRHQKQDDFSLTEEQWDETCEYFNNKCAYCGSEGKLTYDHFYPFSLGGDFMKGHVIPACHSCNSSKNNKSFKEWYLNQEFYDLDKEIKIMNYIELNKQLTLL